MKYIEVEITIKPLEPLRDVLIYNMGNEGEYDSFVETPDGMKAYIPESKYDKGMLVQHLFDSVNEPGKMLVNFPSYDKSDASIIEKFHFETPTDDFVCVVRRMPDKDWNAEWEKNHQAVLVENFCWVRAPFHPHRDDVPYDIVIEPKMSFGTAHHATTYMMLSRLRDIDVKGKQVLDMGSGTGVLSILAAKMGAAHVDAMDVDEWAFKNAKENVEVNRCSDLVECILGDATVLGRRGRYDLILANINRNILMRDMISYVAVMNTDAFLVLSGFYEHDIPDLRKQAECLGLHFYDQMVRDDWASLKFIK